MVALPLSIALIITVLYPGLYFPLLDHVNQNHPIDKLLHHSLMDNLTLCHTQYTILNRLRLSVCGIQDVTVDIRECVNETSTIKGIQLSKDEWLSFMTHVALVDYITRHGPMPVSSQYADHSSNNNQLIDIKEKNRTSCHTQYKVLDRLKITVCGENKEVLVDLREFDNAKPTIIGVQLSFFEWQDFMTYISLVDLTVQNGSKI